MPEKKKVKKGEYEKITPLHTPLGDDILQPSLLKMPNIPHTYSEEYLQMVRMGQLPSNESKSEREKGNEPVIPVSPPQPPPLPLPLPLPPPPSSSSRGWEPEKERKECLPSNSPKEKGIIFGYKESDILEDGKKEEFTRDKTFLIRPSKHNIESMGNHLEKAFLDFGNRKINRQRSLANFSLAISLERGKESPYFSLPEEKWKDICILSTFQSVALACHGLEAPGKASQRFVCAVTPLKG